MNHKKDKALLKEYLPKLVKGKMTLNQVAISTGYTVRQIYAIKKRYIEEGASCLIHKGTNKPSPRRIPEEIRQKVVQLYLSEYDGYNFTFFNDILSDDYDIHLSYRTLYNILNENGVKSPEKHHQKKIEKHHRTRTRRQNEGDLMQIDGTPFAWFSWCGDKSKYCIVAGVDDATSKLVSMYMTENECLYGYMEMLRICYEKYGSPREIYSDRAAIFCVTPRQKDKLTILEQLQGVHEKKTQWQRILDQMHINQILAWSPQAKGRVERMWHTVQDRLPHYFKKHHIRTMEEANKFMNEVFIPIYNEKFGKEPADDDTFYARLNDDDLDQILCARFPLRTDVNGQFKFRGMTFAVEGARYCATKNIELCVNQQGLMVYLGGQYYKCTLLDEIIDEVNDLVPKVVKNIIQDSLMKDMKKESA